MKLNIVWRKKKTFQSSYNRIKTMFVKETKNFKFQTNSIFGDDESTRHILLQTVRSSIQFNFNSNSHKHKLYTDVKTENRTHANIYRLYLYDSPNYSRALIASLLWSIAGQTHDWHHHYKVFVLPFTRSFRVEFSGVNI